MKTLGQVLKASFAKIPQFASLDQIMEKEWEAAAQAVRAAVIDECAKACEDCWTAAQAEEAIRNLVWP